MLWMAFDHVCDAFSPSRVQGELGYGPPPDVASTLDLVARLGSHFVAPAFCILAGVSIRLALTKSKTHFGRRLLERGVFLIVVEALLLHAAVTFQGVWFWGVLSAIGVALCLNVPFVRASNALALVTALVLIFGYRLLEVVPLSQLLATLLYRAGQSGPLVVLYTVLPWTGFVLLGQGIAAALRNETLPRGVAFLTCAVSFVVARAWIGAANLFPSDNSFWLMSKYPASPSYSLFALTMFFAHAWLVKRLPRLIRAQLETIGRVPLFFYVVHLLVITVASAAAFSLPIWGCVIAAVVLSFALVPLCERWHRHRKRRRNWITRNI